jgi:DNA-binding NarL/FixJ family response regulator
LLREVALWHPDLAIIDVRMPPGYSTEGIQAALRIRELYPDVAILLLSQQVESRNLSDLFPDSQDLAGIGYLLKERATGIADFCGIIRNVAGGGVVMDPEVVTALVDSPRRPSLLTEREHEVLALMAEGLSNRALADRLRIAPKTLETHISTIFRKLDLHSEVDENRRVRAVLAYLFGQIDRT